MSQTVMVVDDQSGIRLLFKEIVTQDGYQFISAENGKEALDMIEKHKPDLLMLDYNLPIMNGKQLLDSLKKKNIYVPTILMSGLPEQLEEEKKESGLVKKVLAKPFNIIDVRREIHELLDKEK